MKNFIYYISLAIILIISSCERDEIEVYNSDNFIYFKRASIDTFDYSFALNPGKSEDVLSFEIKLIGTLSEQDRPVNISLDEELTTAGADNFEIINNYKLRSNSTSDTIYVKVKNTPKLAEETVKLVFDIQGNEYFNIGPKANSKLFINVNDMVSRPSWWTNAKSTEYLGDYSDKKYRLFVKLAGRSDFSDATNEHFRAYALRLKYYLQEMKDKGETVLEENGQPMKVNVVG